MADQHDCDRGRENAAREGGRGGKPFARDYGGCGLAIFNKPAGQFTGQFLLDEIFLRAEGTDDFSQYAIAADAPLRPDLLVSPEDLAKIQCGLRIGGQGTLALRPSRLAGRRDSRR